jgi:hypothetical protein
MCLSTPSGFCLELLPTFDLYSLCKPLHCMDWLEGTELSQCGTQSSPVPVVEVLAKLISSVTLRTNSVA